jgi:hypothetical protein
MIELLISISPILYWPVYSFWPDGASVTESLIWSWIAVRSVLCFCRFGKKYHSIEKVFSLRCSLLMIMRKLEF